MHTKEIQQLVLGFTSKEAVKVKPSLTVTSLKTTAFTQTVSNKLYSEIPLLQ